MDDSKIYIDFSVPKGWQELSDKQLLFLFSLFALDLSPAEVAATCLLVWSNTSVIGRQYSGAYLLKKGKSLFEITPLQLAELAVALDWLGTLPPNPVRVSKVGKATALQADFIGVPFESFIICDNLYQGYLQTQQDSLLDQLAAVLYPGIKKFSVALRIGVFYWFASLKEFFASRFSDFFQPATAGQEVNLLGSSPIAARLQEAMDAQIRALTKGDVTKEKEILALDTWRALTELNAQARDYKNLQSNLKK